MTTPKNPKDDLIGKTLGQFEIEEEIGRGGMATVYKARQRSMNRTVAIKVLPRQMLHDPGFYERFEREVNVISHLENPHILPIYDYGQEEGLPYIAMRYLGGGSLEQRIRRSPVKIDEIEKPLNQVAQALDYAHQQGIIHRDLKPGNIMLDENGNAYLTDFGIARVLGSDLTGSMIIGTPAYMSPEQANGLPVDGRSDIYSLGIVLFEWMTGRGPYQAETPMAVLLKQIQEPMPSIRQIRGDVPQSVEDVIIKATSKDPNRRFSSAGEFAQAFANALRGMSFPTNAIPKMDVPLPVGGNVTAPIPTQMPPYQSNPTPYQQVNTPYQQSPTPYPTYPPQYMPNQTGQMQKRSNLPIILVGVVILALAAVGVVLIITGMNRPAPATTNAIPTAFPRSTIIEQSSYSISMLDEFIPSDTLPLNYLDLSEGNQIIHVWYADEYQVFIELTLIQSDTASLQAQADAHADANFPANDAVRFIDEATAEDGTIRKSYRLSARDGDMPIPTPNNFDVQLPGQLDVFYIPRGTQLAIIEMYTADVTGNRYVSILQAILDSFRTKASA
ncbi:MAG: protein kinase [Anaerolineae bacterium]|nr:protein kinase [Anaerolineae bacterium]